MHTIKLDCYSPEERMPDHLQWCLIQIKNIQAPRAAHFWSIEEEKYFEFDTTDGQITLKPKDIEWWSPLPVRSKAESWDEDIESVKEEVESWSKWKRNTVRRVL